MFMHELATQAEVPAPSPSFVHPSTVVDENVEIGHGTKVWHFGHIMSGARIGANCSFGQNLFVGANVKVGNEVRVQNNVSIFSGVEIEDKVFLGPSCVFTNDLFPRAGISKPVVRTLVRQGATVGANATVVCGIVLGMYCMVGAGSVVTKDVKPYALVVGNPAKQRGWVSEHGEKLSLPVSLPKGQEMKARCPVTAQEYTLIEDTLSQTYSSLNNVNFQGN